MSPNGNGTTLLQDYLDGTNPNQADSGLRITAYTSNSDGSSSNITFTSSAGRLYAIEVNNDIRQPLNWTDSGLGLFVPDPGPTTTKVILPSPLRPRVSSERKRCVRSP